MCEGRRFESSFPTEKVLSLTEVPFSWSYNTFSEDKNVHKVTNADFSNEHSAFGRNPITESTGSALEEGSASDNAERTCCTSAQFLC